MKEPKPITIADYPHGEQFESQYGPVTFGEWLEHEIERIRFPVVVKPDEKPGKVFLCRLPI